MRGSFNASRSSGSGLPASTVKLGKPNYRSTSDRHRQLVRILQIVPLVALACEQGFAKDFEFVVIGDTRPRFESESFRPFERLIGKINGAKPAFVVNLGDLIYGYGPASKERQWDKYQAVISRILVPYYQVPGNHDTHSKQARKVYGRRFGRFYESFDYTDCHFVLLDNTEEETWGYLGPTELSWLKRDLSESRAGSAFIFMHFPVWEPERITPEYYEFWATTLHPLFKASRVRAVFAGHYHAYGPTREFDGIRYFITGGGGAELRPEYRKSGGEYHFMKVRVSGDAFDVRVMTEDRELADAEADVMGGLQFAARNVSRIGISAGEQDLKTGIRFTVSVANPYLETMTGEATWLVDASTYAVDPERIRLQIPAGATHRYDFILRTSQQTTTLESLPLLQFSVAAGGRRLRFHREVRLLQDLATPYCASAPVLNGDLSDWPAVPALRLGQGQPGEAELRGRYDLENLYLAVVVPTVDAAEAEELGFSDGLQIGVARQLSANNFGPDQLRFGFKTESSSVWDRTAGHKAAASIPGVKSLSRKGDGRTTHEIGLPLRLLKDLKASTGSQLMINISFPMPETTSATNEAEEPGANTFSYRVRYGSDSLVPVYFVKLQLQSR
jgi:hypothetical protein